VRLSREAVFLHEGDVTIAMQFGERIRRIELGEDEVEELFRERKARFLKITVNRLRMG
jgi:predicted nucleic acid-binding Zn finger protein